MATTGKYNILVTGGAGFLGSHVADRLSEEGHRVTVFDIKPSSFIKKNQTMVVGDIREREVVFEAAREQDFVFHFGAIADIDDAEHRPYDTMEVNVMGTANLLEACRAHGVDRIVFASSIYVYSNAGGFYRVSKHACELLLEEYKKKYDLDYTILRFGTLYGTRSDVHNSVFRYLKEALETGKILFRGRGDEVREYIHVKDSADICLKILDEKFACQNLILTGHHRIRVTELLSMISEILDGKVEVIHDPHNFSSHYIQTPYSYIPRVGQRIVADTYCDLGQSLVEILQEIDRPERALEL